MGEAMLFGKLAQAHESRTAVSGSLALHLSSRATSPLTSTSPLRTALRMAEAVVKRSGHTDAMASRTSRGPEVGGSRALAMTP